MRKGITSSSQEQYSIELIFTPTPKVNGYALLKDFSKLSEQLDLFGGKDDFKQSKSGECGNSKRR